MKVITPPGNSTNFQLMRHKDTSVISISSSMNIWMTLLPCADSTSINWFLDQMLPLPLQNGYQLDKRKMTCSVSIILMQLLSPKLKVSELLCCTSCGFLQFYSSRLQQMAPGESFVGATRDCLQLVCEFNDVSNNWMFQISSLSSFHSSTFLCNFTPSIPLSHFKQFPNYSSLSVRCSTSESQQSESQESNQDAPKKKKRLSEQSSWEAKDSDGNDYLYRLGAEADNMNIAVGARAGVIDDLFAGNFLGKDSDIVFDYRQKVTRSFAYLQGDYYIAPAFLDKVVCHIVKNYISHLLNAKVPLILGIWGGKGQGKSFQTELIFQAMGIEPVIMSAGELESERAGEPGKLIRERYRTASQVVQNQGKMSCLMINDIDAGLGRFGNTQVTVNNQIVVGTLMNLCDNPTRVSVGQDWRQNDITHRIPIIVTGNDFSTMYAPLIRDGRMEKFYWQPTQEDIENIVCRMYEKDGITKDEVATIVNTFPNQALDFYGAMRSRTYDQSILKWVEDTGGAEDIGRRLIRQRKKGELPVFVPPEQTVEALLESGYSLVKEQKLIMDSKLSKEYMKNMDE